MNVPSSEVLHVEAPERGVHFIAKRFQIFNDLVESPEIGARGPFGHLNLAGI